MPARRGCVRAALWLVLALVAGCAPSGATSPAAAPLRTPAPAPSSPASPASPAEAGPVGPVPGVSSVPSPPARVSTPPAAGGVARPTRAPAGVTASPPARTRAAVAPVVTPVSRRGGSDAAGRQRRAGSTALGCYGNGADGPRVQALRVVAAGGRAPSDGEVARWLADVDVTVDDSARLTGGHRHVRYVTGDGAPGCAALAPSVVVAAGALSSLQRTVDALRALGYDRADRKYLLWVDADVYCGIATTFLDDARTGNANDGAAAQYARVDRTCWGGGETHELVHAMGGVQPSAPHGTAELHCTDGADLMCFGGDRCPSGYLALLDCGGDDYFSTAPAAGSYLATHWNVADSRFLTDRLDDPPAAPAPAPSASPTRCPLLTLGRC